MITTPFTLAMKGAAPDVVLHPYLLDNSEEIEIARRRPLVLVLPGGGYSFRSFREAEPVAVRLLGLGLSACVVDYAVAPNRFPAALLQVLATIAYAREQADAWHIDPDKIILMGFSAGGHLAASAGVFWNKPHYAAKLGRDSAQLRPNALVLGYPVITTGDAAHRDSFDNLLGDEIDIYSQTVSLEKQVSNQVPPTFLWHTWDDASVPVDNSLQFARALKRHGVPHALHIFPDGVHGISLANREVFGPERASDTRPEVARWIDLFDTWLQTL